MKELEEHAAGFCPYCKTLVIYSNRKQYLEQEIIVPEWIEMLEREMRDQMKTEIEKQQCPKGHRDVIILVTHAPTMENLYARLKLLGQTLYDFLMFTEGRWVERK